MSGKEALYTYIDWIVDVLQKIIEIIVTVHISHLQYIITDVFQEREIRAFRTLVNRSVQTPRSLLVDDTEVFRKEVEASTAKLEESCKQMEVFCEKIKAEKQELDQKYRIEREAVKALKKHVHELEEAKVLDFLCSHFFFHFALF